jgi:hypothetical protein
LWRLVKARIIEDQKEEYESELVEIDYIAEWPWWRGWLSSLITVTAIAITIHCAKDLLGIIK